MQYNLEAINEAVDKSGLKLQAIADAMFKTRSTLYNKLSGKSDFTAPELIALCKILDPTKPEELMQIFLFKK